MASDDDIPEGPLIGLSIRFCIADVVHRRVDPDRIVSIISDTDYTESWQWENRVRLGGMHSWWAYDPMRGVRVFDQLLSDRRIYQPRLDGLDPIEFEPGRHWLAAGPDPDF